MPIIDGKKIDILFSADDIAQRNLVIAQGVAKEQPENLLVLPILKGSFVFAADLIRALHEVGIASTVEFITVSSYGTGTTSGELKLLHDFDSNIQGRDILLVDDILESGKTLTFVRDLLMSRGARRIFIAALLDKKMKRQTNIEADFIGFSCPDHFVVGYGMDAAHAFRQLPFVGVVSQ